ncbi:hypothetical protein J5X84_15885 [Streptosporangiaceae bacterium NEAU-GS5]|nr:hypothetical protein [Streptosporangiaceae bacterium NEAU-GS5]
MRARWFGVALVIGLIAYGCAAHAEMHPAISSPSQIRLPLDAFKMTDEEYLARKRAIAIVGRACMSRFSLDWPVPRRTHPRLRTTERRYGVVGIETAERWGYHPPIDEVADRQARLDEQAEDSQPAAAQAVWIGARRMYGHVAVPLGGCFGEAEHLLEQRLPAADLQLAERLDAAASATAERDPRVHAAFDAWRDCMRQAGLSYADPWAANNDPAWAANPGPDGVVAGPTPREREVARADAACRSRVDLVGIWVATEADHQRRLIDAHRAELATVRRWLDAERSLINATLATAASR